LNFFTLIKQEAEQIKSESIRSMNPKILNMSTKINSRSLFIFFLSSICLGASGQDNFCLYNNVGKNNVSDGLYIKSAIIGSCKFRKTTLETGIEADLKNNNHKGFSGYTLDISRVLMNKNTTLELRGFGIFTYPSEILMESNLGALIKMCHRRFKMELGTDFRTYYLRHNAVDDYVGANSSMKIREIYNIIYSFNYFVNPTDEKWNLGLTVTNIDHFIINQETNPFININGFYKLSEPVTVYAQAWYKCAGVTNLELDHFGYFFRTGIIWNIN
jgi:hypothetical protein